MISPHLPVIPARIRNFLGVLLAAIFLFPLGTPLFAKISFQLDRREVYENETVKGSLSIENEPGNFRLELPEIEGLEITDMGTRNTFSSTTIINGKVTELKRFSLEFSIKAKKAGAYDISGVELISDDGRKVQVETFRVNFAPIQPNENFWVRLEPLEESFYPNQKLRFKMIVSFNGRLRDYQIDFGLFENPKSVSLGLIQKEYRGNAPKPKFNIGKYEIPFLQTGDTDMDNRYEAFFEFTPKNGKTELEPVFMEAILTFQKNGRTLRDRVMVKSNPLVFNIKPFPEEGKPKFFDGAAGTYFSVDSFVDGYAFQVGDPIPLRITIVSDEPVTGGFRAYFEPDQVEVQNLTLGKIENYSAEGNKIRYTQIFYPNREGTLVIPEASFSYFIPRFGEYRTLNTSTKTLEISPAKLFDESSIFIADSLKNLRPENMESLSPSELRTNPGEDALSSFFLALMLPPSFSALFLAGLWARRRFYNPEAVHQRQYESERSRRISHLKNLGGESRFAAEFAEHFSWMLLTRFRLRNGYLGNIRELKGLSETQSGILLELQTFLDAAKYSSGNEKFDSADIIKKFEKVSALDNGRT